MKFTRYEIVAHLVEQPDPDSGYIELLRDRLNEHILIGNLDQSRLGRSLVELGSLSLLPICALAALEVMRCIPMLRELPVRAGFPPLLVRILNSPYNSLVPVSWMTPTSLNYRDAENYTPVHAAMEFGTFHRLPSRHLDEATFRVVHQALGTPLELAIRHNLLAQVPRKFLTPAVLDTCNSDGQTVLHLAALKGVLHQLPRRCRTQKRMCITDGFDMPAWLYEKVAGRVV